MVEKVKYTLNLIMDTKEMTKEETIQGLENIESRAIDFPYMTASDWVAVAAAKRHLANSIEVKDVDLDDEIDKWICDAAITHEDCSITDIISTAKHFFELGLKSHKGDKL